MPLGCPANKWMNGSKRTMSSDVNFILYLESQIGRSWTIHLAKDVHGNEDPDQPIWLGRVMPNPAWGGQGVLRNVTGSAVSYEMGIEV